MRCDYIAEGVIKATKELQMEIPLVVRLKGTKEAEAKEYVPLIFSGYLILPNIPPDQDDPRIRSQNHPLRWPRRSRRARRPARYCLNLRSCHRICYDFEPD